MATAVHVHVVSVMHTPPPSPHMQPEVATSGIIPQFTKEIAEVAEGGEMVRKEAGREGGRMEGEREEGWRERGRNRVYVM